MCCDPQKLHSSTWKSSIVHAVAADIWYTNSVSWFFFCPVFSGVKKYSVVHFHERDEVSVVPSKWVRGNEVLWPPYKSTVKITAAIKDMEETSPRDWEQYKCRVMVTCGKQPLEYYARPRIELLAVVSIALKILFRFPFSSSFYSFKNPILVPFST